MASEVGVRCPRSGAATRLQELRARWVETATGRSNGAQPGHCGVGYETACTRGMSRLPCYGPSCS
jgi:hypothetical protein